VVVEEREHTGEWLAERIRDGAADQPGGGAVHLDDASGFISNKDAVRNLIQPDVHAATSRTARVPGTVP
jgi:hypothetical protein